MSSTSVPDHPTREPAPPILIRIDVNGVERSLAAEPSAILLDVLRDELELTGTKLVCEMGNCGACTVLLDDRAVYSCLVLAAECEGHGVETVESLAEGSTLAPIQQAFVDCDGFQCGFCTSGQLMSLEALRRSGQQPHREAIVEAVTGNLCRCGAYPHIIAAAETALGTEGTRR